MAERKSRYQFDVTPDTAKVFGISFETWLRNGDVIDDDESKWTTDSEITLTEIPSNDEIFVHEIRLGVFREIPIGTLARVKVENVPLGQHEVKYHFISANGVEDSRTLYFNCVENLPN